MRIPSDNISKARNGNKDEIALVNIDHYSKNRWYDNLRTKTNNNPEQFPQWKVEDFSF